MRSESGEDAGTYSGYTNSSLNDGEVLFNQVRVSVSVL